MEEKRGHTILAEEEELNQLSIEAAQPQPGGIREREQGGRPGPGLKLLEREGAWWRSQSRSIRKREGGWWP